MAQTVNVEKLMVRQCVPVSPCTSEVRQAVDLNALPVLNALATKLALIRNVRTHVSIHADRMQTAKSFTIVQYVHVRMVLLEIRFLDVTEYQVDLKHYPNLHL